MIRGLLALVVLVLVTPAIALAAVASGLLRRREIDLRPARSWSRVMLRAVGARVRYAGLEHRDTPRPCFYVSNHESNVDIWALIQVLPVDTKFVAKRSLFRIPFLGWAMRRAGFVEIDRANRSRAIHSLELAAARVRGGVPLIVFPEGTRSRDGGLGPFKKGSFHLALRAEATIVPVAIRGSGRILAARSWRVRPGAVEVRFLPPVDIARFLPDDHAGLLEAVRSRIASALDSAAVVDAAPVHRA